MTGTVVTLIATLAAACTTANHARGRQDARGLLAGTFITPILFDGLYGPVIPVLSVD